LTGRITSAARLIITINPHKLHVSTLSTSAACAKKRKVQKGKKQKGKNMPAIQATIEQVKKIGVDQYKYGFETRIESIKAPKGLNESTVRYISAKKGEPD
jgi:hypothetical protein